MEIIKVKIADIVPYEHNAKSHPREQIDQIKKSIEEFGNNDPIAIDENNVVIEGHGRLIAMKELGYEEAEAIRVVGLTESQKNAYRLAHNQLTMNSGYDLSELYAELERIEGVDMAGFGFDLDGIKGELSQMGDREAETFEDEIPSDQDAPAITKPGDVWILGGHRLLCGDCTKKEDVDKLVRGGASRSPTDRPAV